MGGLGWSAVMAIGQIIGIEGYGSFIRAGLTGSRLKIGSAQASSIFPRQLDNLGQLLSSHGTNLRSLQASRNAVDQIRSELTKLRAAIGTAREQIRGFADRPDLRAIVRNLEQTVEKATFGQRDIYETRPVYETRDVYATRDIYETRPVYEDHDIYATNVSGTRDLSSFGGYANAGISNGSTFTVQVANGPITTIKFKDSKHIEVTVNGSTQSIAFNDKNGEWRSGLVSALNSIANLSAEIASDGSLEMHTANAESVTITPPADPNKNPLSSLGLSAGTTDASVVGTEQVQVGTEEVVVGQEEYVAGTEQVQVGTEDVKVGTEQAQTGTIQVSQGARAIVVGFDRVGRARVDVGENIRNLVAAANTLISGHGVDAARGLVEGLSALLGNSDFAAALTAGDANAIDSATRQIDELLQTAKILDAQMSTSARESGVTGSLALGAALLSAGLQNATVNSFGLARHRVDALYKSSADIAAGGRLSFWS
jgi:hypothetical protein